VAIIDRGRIVDIGSPAELVRRNCPERRAIVVTEDSGAVERFRALPGVDSVDLHGSQLTIRGRSDDLVMQVIRCLAEHGSGRLFAEAPILEDVFLKLTAEYSSAPSFQT